MKWFRHRKLKLALVVVFLLPLCIVSWQLSLLFLAPILPLDHPCAIIQISRSTSAHEFVHYLEKKKYINSSTLFLLVIRLEDLTHRLKAGIYEIKPGESAMQLLHKVVAGEVLNHYFTIIAGTTQLKVTQDLMQTAHLEYHPEDWTLIQKEHANAEGLLLAETYKYPAGSTSKSLLEKAHQDLMVFLTQSWNNRAPNLPYKTPYDLLIAASIVEKESALAQERKLIAGVLVNRLKKGMPLQMDPTVIYALESAYQGKLSHKDLLVDSPYNSYKYRGLPPTPIAMVSKEAILAAASPQASNFLYFVAKGDGTHQFSETYVQQRQAIQAYQHKDL